MSKQRESNLGPGTRFTPGPWKIHRENIEHPNGRFRFVGTSDFDEEASEGQIVAKLTDSPEIAANARLIAASPDLYAACKEALDEYDANDCNPEYCPAMVALHALAKAGGGE